MAFFEDNTITHDVTTVGAFRAWASMIAKGLEEVGLVQTADTGQINLVTVELPATSTFAGYQIWRFNDSQQEAEPIYLKIEYGRGAANARPNLRLQWGRGSNGTGTLTTASVQATQTPTGTPSGNGLIYIAFYKGSFTLVDCALTTEANSTAPNLMVFAADRLKNTANETLNAFAASRGPAGEALTSFTVFSSGAWTESAQFLRTSGSETFENLVVPGVVQILKPLVSAPLRALCGSVAGVIGASDTGKLSLGGEEVKFKRLAMEKLLTFAGGASGTTAVNHNFLAPNE